ncbi:MAG: flagellar protein FlaG [Gammaproteobacteria bacterium]|nr:flagellar protein FlaG [Gammaproteobacteria bacterium]MBU1979133.1 flagellar protein FlaG [Gammaproteobacteria bacterium]
MIIQNTSALTQTGQPERHISNDAKLVADSATPATAPQPSSQPSSQALKSAVNDVNKALRLSNQSLEISLDSSTKQRIVKLVDTQTGELIRQIPSEQMLAIAQSIDQYLQHGQLLSEKV